MAIFRCYNCMKEYDTDIATLCPHCNHNSFEPIRKPHYIKPGTVLEGRYMIGRVIGSGGFGITYTAWDKGLQRKVAIKEYYPSGIAARQGSSDEICVKTGDDLDKYEFWLKAFIDEALHLASMDKLKGIVHIFNTFVANSTAYIVMEYLEGETLKDILKKNEKPLDYEEVIEMVVPALYSLDSVHREKIIHRDIAPDNIMRLPDGKIKIFDFGSAKNSSVVSDEETMAILVKHGYSAPEQYDFDGVQGPWTDVYSMSAVIYHLITGIRPVESVKRRDNGEKIVPPSQLGIEIPQAIEDAIMKGLSIDERYRIRNAKEFADELMRGLTAERIRKKKRIEQESKWTKKMKIGVSIAAILTVFIIGFMFIGITPGNSERSYLCSVENLEGRSSDEVLSWAKENGVSVKFVGTLRTDNEYENSKVVWQEIPEGYKVSRKESDEFVLRVKTGVYDVNASEYNSRVVKMPDLSGKTESKARDLLEQAGLINYKFAEKRYDEIEKGCVCEQSVKAEKQVRADTEIFIVISKGQLNEESESQEKEQTEKSDKKTTKNKSEQ